jgi:hypothetical protein
MKRRAIESLLQIAQRMTQLCAVEVPREKLLGELGGMSAWVSAFACQLGGIPIELSPMPQGDLSLASVEVTTTGLASFDARTTLPAEGVYAEYIEAARRVAAVALGLVALAKAVLERGEAVSDVESAVRHRTAELRLAARLAEALLAYEHDLGPEGYVAEQSFHGMQIDDVEGDEPAEARRDGVLIGAAT